jgi:hypothetical protein
LGVSGKDTVVFVVDVMKVVSAHALVPGTSRSADDALPKVRMDRDRGAASIEVPDRDAPKGLVAERLVEGTGPVVKAGTKRCCSTRRRSGRPRAERTRPICS